jgi:hypothetical protein
MLPAPVPAAAAVVQNRMEKKMANSEDRLDVHVVVTVTGAALSAIVDNAKRIAVRDENGRYRVDTADKVGEMISLFLEKYDFENFVRDADNYSG